MRRPPARDALIALGLFALAVAVRVPYLQLIPRYTDEVRRIIWSVHIAEGGFWPLAFKNGYNGPLLLYLVASGLKVSWSVFTPRWVVLIVGSLGVPVVYAAGRALRGRTCGLTAGLLLTTSFIPVVVFGHVAWAISLGAGAMVAGWWAAIVAVEHQRPRWLIAAGFLSGLAVQCHPVVAFQLPGLVGWLLARPAAERRPLLRFVPRAVMAAAVAYSPIVLHHLLQWWRDGESVLTSTRDLRGGQLFSVRAYAGGLRDLSGSLVDVLSGAGHHAAWPWTADPAAVAAVIVALGALAYCAVRGPRLPVWLMGSVILTLPLFIQEYNFPLSARYSALFVPAIYLAVGAAVADVWRWLGDAPLGRRRAGQGAMAVAVAGATLFGFARVMAFYTDEAANGKTNAPILAMADACRAGTVLLDDEIAANYSASGQISRILEALLLLQRTPFHKMSSPDEFDAFVADHPGDYCVIISDAHRTEVDFGPQLVAVTAQHVAAGNDGDGFGLYRWRR